MVVMAPQPRVSIRWNAGRTADKRDLSSGIIFGASWAYHKRFASNRLVHVYLGLWVLTLRLGSA
jgi:hypothetical protein